MNTSHLITTRFIPYEVARTEHSPNILFSPLLVPGFVCQDLPFYCAYSTLLLSLMYWLSCPVVWAIAINTNGLQLFRPESVNTGMVAMIDALRRMHSVTKAPELSLKFYLIAESEQTWTFLESGSQQAMGTHGHTFWHIQFFY